MNIDFLYKGKICGIILLEIVDSRCLIHMDVYTFSHGIMKELQKDIKETILSIVKKAGYKSLTATYVYKDGAEVWKKFIKKLGFPDPHYIYMSDMEV